jgi:hypothetical protein
MMGHTSIACSTNLLPPFESSGSRVEVVSQGDRFFVVFAFLLSPY